MTVSHSDVTLEPPAAATWRLLGVVRAGHPEVEGVAYQEFGRVAAALTGHDDRGPVREALRRHAEQVESLFAAGPVLPARYGTLLADPEAVVPELLEPNEQALSASLGEVEGRVEVLVRAEQVEDLAVAEAVRRDADLRRDAALLQQPGGSAPHDVKVRFGERVAQAVARLADDDVARVVDRLSPLAVSVRGEAPGSSAVLIDASYLVPAERFDEFDAAVGELAEWFGGRVTVSAVGPLPPYSFADLQAG